MWETLKSKYGPLPVWAYALIGIVLLAWYMSHKKSAANAAAQQQNQQQGVSSNLGTVPVSNLTTAAQPMPIQLGDTFVNTGTGGGISTTNGSPNTTLISPVTPSNSMQAAGAPAPSPATNV